MAVLLLPAQVPEVSCVNWSGEVALGNSTLNVKADTRWGAPLS